MITSLVRSFVHELTIAFNPGEWIVLASKLRHTNRQALLITFRNLLPQLLLYYVLLSPIVAAPLYDMMLFHPTMTGPFNAHRIIGTKIENVFFRSQNGKQLHGWYLKAAYAKHVVLISHGNGGNLTSRIPLIAMFLRNGVSVFIYDYQGYGRSAGSPSVQNMCEDGDAAFGWLVSEGYRDHQIIVFGESLGTGVACQLAARRPVAGIILQSAYSSLLDLARQKILWLRLYPASSFPTQEQLQNAVILSQPHAPLLLVHGERDRLIPVAHSEQIYRTAVPPKTFILLPDAGHNDIYDVNFKQYNGAVQQFLSGLP